jgi:LemA protein
MSGIITLVVLVLLILLIINIYNQLVTLRNRYQNGFAQIEVQLKRRYDLIPNLVETAKAYARARNPRISYQRSQSGRRRPQSCCCQSR